MSCRDINAIVETSISAALKERSAKHPVLPVATAVNLAMLRMKSTPQDRPMICRLVCDLGIRRGLVLQFNDD